MSNTPANNPTQPVVTQEAAAQVAAVTALMEEVMRKTALAAQAAEAEATATPAPQAAGDTIRLG